MYFKEIVGHILLEISLNDGDIILKTDKATARLEAIGDCCSQGWIDDLAVSGTLPSKIVSIDGMCQPFNLADDDKRFDEGDVVVAYGTKIVIENGLITFNVWNNSNGYYGSALCFSASY